MTDDESPYRMTLSLNVLNHLGLNLYSNVPAVVSEAVANSWDADAHSVNVTIDPDNEIIEIEDDGIGMTAEDINQWFLHVGYQRRKDPERGGTTTAGRPVMGRKGIGKLSLFSIANTVDVFTTKNGEQHAFRMEVQAIKETIGSEVDPGTGQTPSGTYNPEPLDEFPEDLERGTRIRLTNLKKRVHMTEGPLRIRLARRFTVIGDEWDFAVNVNDQPVQVTDRDYFHKLQFIWTYGDESEARERYVSNCRKLEQTAHRDGETPQGRVIIGWIGTAEKPKDLEVSYPGAASVEDDLNKISLIVRGKMARWRSLIF